MSEIDFPNRNILIVEDDVGLGKTLLTILTKEGYEVRWATTGTDAVRMVQESFSPVHVVLLDIHLPDQNGLNILRSVKKINPHIGAIMMTGQSEMETAIAALNEGAFAYVEKPYNIDEVKAVILRLAEKQRLVWHNQKLLKELMELTEDLEGKIRDRTLDLQKTNLKLANTVTELRQAFAVKSEFVSMISHELRTPLAIVIGFCQALDTELDSLDKETIRRYLKRMDIGAHRLLKIIEQIMALSQIEEKGLTLIFAPFDVNDFTQRLQEDFKNRFPERKLTLTIGKEIQQVISDRDRLQQVLGYLIENAVKYATPTSEIKLRIERRAEEILFSVVDDGPGIPELHKEKVFDPFFRTQDETNMRSPGSGLGLTISKAIVEALGGRIWVEDEIPQGCRMRVAIPLSAPRPDLKPNEPFWTHLPNSLFNYKQASPNND